MTATARAQRTIWLKLKEPPSANRWWRNVKGRMVTSAAAREYKQHVANECVLQRVKPIAAPRTVCVVIEWDRKRKSGDLDKRIGVLLDALQGSAYENDSQIVRIVAERRDGGRGEVQVTVVTTETA